MRDGRNGIEKIGGTVSIRCTEARLLCVVLREFGIACTMAATILGMKF